MSEFWTLYKKNFKIWVRNTCGCFMELLFLFMFLGIFVLLSRVRKEKIKPTTSHLVNVTRIGPDNSLLGGTPLPFPQEHLAQFQNLISGPFGPTVFKNCSFIYKEEDKSLDTSGIIALGPPTNPAAMALDQLFQAVNLRTKMFDNEEGINSYIKEPNYEGLDSSGNKRQICFGLLFKEAANRKWTYSLHYNFTGDANYDTVPLDKEWQIEPFITEYDEGFKGELASGLFYFINFVDNIILQTETGNHDARINTEFAYVPVKAYKTSDLFTITSNGELEQMILFPLLIIFIRLISGILTEKQDKIAENMRNMGMSMFSYYSSWLAFYFTVLAIYTVVWSIVIKLVFLKHGNFLFIMLLYFLPGFFLLSLGFLITGFFVRAKPGILSGIVSFFGLFMMTIARGNITETYSKNIWFGLDPFVSLQKALASMILLESKLQPFGFGLWNTKILRYRYSLFVYSNLGLGFLMLILGVYIDMVWPKEIGVTRHPLFCFMRKKGKKTNDVKQVPGKTQQSDAFEEVTDELLMQKQNNETLEVENIVKVYPNGKKAVDDLSLSMYSNQIFALLGHNGAGKTTAISMISGLLPITSGSIKVMGLDTVQDSDEIKRLMGVCPQKNPIYSILTVKEHLDLYASVKKTGLKGEELDKEIDQILADIDLLDKKDYKAGGLSGGQKRKLCVACAFIGGSKVVLLDEPSSGLDVSARRHLWEMLEKYKKDRIIILTTHFMDEADYLGDRIGIMGQGKLQACGSSLFLKNRFGVGYSLTMVKGEAGSSTEKVTELIKEKIPDAELESDISREIKYILPTKDLDKFEELFQKLEETYQQLGIESFGVGLTTLEDVFLKIGDKLGEHKQENIPEEENQAKDLEDGEVELEKIRVKGAFNIFMMHFEALIIKRFIYYRRDYKSIFCEIVLPIIVIVVGGLLTRIKFIRNVESGPLTNAVYEFAPNVVINNQYPNFLTKLDKTNLDLNSQTFASLTAMDTYILNKEDPESIYNVYLSSLDNTNQEYNYTVLLNSTAYHSLNLAQNLINSAILKEATGDNSAYIKMEMIPLPISPYYNSFEGSVNGAVFVLLMALGFAFIPSSMVMFIVMERENNSKHQQIVSGVSLSAYWLSNLVLDYAKYLIVAAATFIILLIFKVDALYKGQALAMTLLLLAAFGPAMIGFSYAGSFLFKHPSSAQIFFFIHGVLTGLVFLIVVLILRAIKGTRKLSLNAIEFGMRANPMFGVCFGLYSNATPDFWENILNLDYKIKPWTRYGSLYDFLSLILVFVVSFTLVFVIENWKGKKGKETKRGEAYRKIEKNVEEDIDVINEAKMVKEATNLSVKVQDLSKNYYIVNSDGLCSKNKTVKVKRAVKSISFGVQKGECFGLLGTNGAGKTTTFKVLSGELQPSEGLCQIAGFDVGTEMKKIRHLIGYCPQFDALLDLMTTREHLNLYAAIKGIPKNKREKLIADKIKELNLTQFEHVQAGTYSGGNKRKLSVAMALIGNPPIVFLDEPSSGMDPEARRFMWSVVGRISNQQKKSSVVLTTHSMEEAEALSTKLAIMVEGKIRCIGSVQHLKGKYGKGFELETKIRKISKEDIRKLLGDGPRRIDENKVLTNFGEVYGFLEDINHKEIVPEITDTGTGAFIKADLKKHGQISTNSLLEFVFIQVMSRNLRQFLSQKFGKIELIESHQSYFRFKILDNVLISKLFGEMQRNKTQLGLDQYSIRQTSIEQIFIKFANERVADED